MILYLKVATFKKSGTGHIKKKIHKERMGNSMSFAFCLPESTDNDLYELSPFPSDSNERRERELHEMMIILDNLGF